jgi:multiple sugar transport system ATP-binding protein
MRADIAALQSRLGVTTVYVTHDQAEAMTLGHRVAVLKDGRLQQCDVPRTLYERPANTFVAGFIGSPSMNLLEVPVGADGCSFCGVDVRLPPGLPTTNGSVILGLRPEALELAPGGIEARVEVVEEFGADAHVFCIADYGGETVKLVARSDARRAPEREAKVSLCPRIDEAHVFDAATGARLEPR